MSTVAHENAGNSRVNHLEVFDDPRHFFMIFSPCMDNLRTPAIIRCYTRKAGTFKARLLAAFGSEGK